ncbi:MAG: hypothetical protein IKB79_02420 [Oscillospiraceae bacterium]|nr:hypothetical protein [Oscillospiraceae bacterium]
MARTNFLRGAARRTFASALTAALLLSGTAFAPITTKAAESSGVEELYFFQAQGSKSSEYIDANWGKLKSNVTNIDIGGEKDEKKNPGLFSYHDAQIDLPDGSRELKLFVMSGGVGTGSVTESDDAGGTDEEETAVPDVLDPAKHYGVPYYIVYKNADGTFGRTDDVSQVPSNATSYRKAIKENLSFEIADLLTAGNPIAVAEYGAVNLSMLCGYTHVANANSVVYDDRMQVFVQVDNGDWLEGSVGIRSSQLLGGGSLSVSAGRGGFFYRIETEDLLKIPGVESAQQITGIKVMPYGKEHTTFGYFYIGELQVNGYSTAADFEAAIDNEKDSSNYDHLDPNTLRKIAVKEAERTADIEWTTGTTVTTRYGSSSGTQGYPATASWYESGEANIPYHGPTYERGLDSTRELFQSYIKDGKWTGGTNMSSNTSKTVAGMDCQTFVFNAVSRVSRTYAWACANTLSASGVSIVGRDEDGFTVDDHPKYTDSDILAGKDEQTVYRHYAKAQAGDIVDSYKYSGSAHTRLVKDVVVVKNTDGTINPNASYMLCTEQVISLRYYFKDLNDKIVYTDSSYQASVYANAGYQLLYSCSSREETEYTFNSLRTGGYVAFTLDEYKDGLVEKVEVEAVLGSKQAGQNFVDGGANIAFSSNYRIISYQVELENLTTGEKPYNSGLQYAADSYTIAYNFKSDDLDAKLRALEPGDYRITLTVDSGPFTGEDQSVVTKIPKTFDFAVEEKTELLDDLTVGDVVFIPGQRSGQKTKVFLAYLVASEATPEMVGERFFLDNSDQKYTTNTAHSPAGERSFFWVRTETALSRVKINESNAERDYKYGYHDKIKNLDPDAKTLTLASATGHTRTSGNCRYRFDYSCAGSYGCKGTLSYTNGLKIIDLRTDVVAGKADAVTDIAQVQKLTDQGNAIINTYVPKGTSSGGAASVIIVLDPTVEHSFTAYYDVTAGTTTGGTLLVNGASTISDVPAGEEVTVTAENVTSGYGLGTVYVDGKAIEGTTFTIRGNHTVTADFVEVCAHANTKVLPAVEPTCKQTGLTAGEQCLDCQAILVEQTVLPVEPENHTEVTVPGTPATATTPGLTDGIQCSECGTWIQAQTEIEATGCSVTVTSVEGNGTVTLNKAGDEYAYGEIAIVSAIPNGHYTTEDLSDDEDTTPLISVTVESDYELSQLLVDGVDKTEEVKNGRYTFTVSGNHEITATFVPKGTQEPEVEFGFSGANLVLQDNLAVTYKVDKSLFETEGYEDPYVVFEFNGTQTVVGDYTVIDDKYAFMFLDIAPHKMNDTIYATLHATYEGQDVASQTREYSVATYCYNMLSKYSADTYAEFRTLLVDLLNYGAESQKYMGYRTDALVNAALTETQKGWGTAEMRELDSVLNTQYETVETPAVSWNGATLILGDSITMRFKVQSEDLSGLELKIRSESGRTWTLTPGEFEAISTEDNMYYVYFNGLKAGEMREPIYLTFCNGDTKVSDTVCYSVESYASAKQDDADVGSLVKAMMCYGDSAEAYAN